ncbi:transposase [Streptosporangium minutum]|uniref:transposase n=1 Tax=Streptosporangium minutum TaxID=569862 RepID=UPI00105623AB|nr:transposase [Streptosporangium minutum]
MARFDVTDAELALIEPQLPPAATGPLPRRVRDQFNGILWRFREARAEAAGGRPVTFGPERYRQRNTVERCFQKIKTWRGLATRYDKAPESYEAGLYLRGSIMWLRLLTSTT